MAEKKVKKVKKVAIVQLARDPNLISVEDGGNADIENWPEDGRDNIIPVGKPVRVSIHLANRLLNAGRIENYSIQTIEN